MIVGTFTPHPFLILKINYFTANDHPQPSSIAPDVARIGSIKLFAGHPQLGGQTVGSPGREGGTN